jgi:hypothetical protein
MIFSEEGRGDGNIVVVVQPLFREEEQRSGENLKAILGSRAKHCGKVRHNKTVWSFLEALHESGILVYR